MNHGAPAASVRYEPHVTKTVLLADDSLTIQRVVELAFAGRDDVRLVTVGDGEEAIARIRQSPHDGSVCSAGAAPDASCGSPL